MWDCAFSKVPVTAPYNFDSGTAFYNLIVGPHKVKSVICVDSFQISGEIGYTPFVSQKGQQWEKSNLVLNCRLPYLVF